MKGCNKNVRQLRVTGCYSIILVGIIQRADSFFPVIHESTDALTSAGAAVTGMSSMEKCSRTLQGAIGSPLTLGSVADRDRYCTCALGGLSRAYMERQGFYHVEGKADERHRAEEAHVSNLKISLVSRWASVASILTSSCSRCFVL